MPQPGNHAFFTFCSKILGAKTHFVQNYEPGFGTRDGVVAAPIRGIRKSRIIVERGTTDLCALNGLAKIVPVIVGVLLVR